MFARVQVTAILRLLRRSKTSPLVPCRGLVAWPRTARGRAVMGFARAHVNAAARPSAEHLIRG
eukprot:6275198-Pyramimonas_sp.AAC.1